MTYNHVSAGIRSSSSLVSSHAGSTYGVASGSGVSSGSSSGAPCRPITSSTVPAGARASENASVLGYWRTCRFAPGSSTTTAVGTLAVEGVAVGSAALTCGVAVVAASSVGTGSGSVGAIVGSTATSAGSVASATGSTLKV